MREYQYPGSRWWKFDFHTHTPASTDYRGDPAITPEQWLRSFQSRGLQCVAVTDHNTGQWVDILKSTLEQLKADDPDQWGSFAIFPGVEISCNGGIHVLAIFDPAATSAVIAGLLGAVGYRATPGDSDGVTRDSVEVVLENIRQLGGVAIPAHTDQPKGLLTVLTDHNTLQAVLPKVDALEVINPASSAVVAQAAGLAGRALVLGSDSHEEASIGRGFTWIKMSSPSIEGLRLALLDPDMSVCRSDQTTTDPQPVPEQRILSLKIQNLHINRRTPLELEFSPWTNSIIGGRGSGKSSVIESLRLVTGQDTALEALGEANDIYKAFARFKAPYRNRREAGLMLDNSCLIAEVEKGRGIMAVRYQYQWNATGLTVSQQGPEGWRSTGLNRQQAREQFPVQVFSQKQIFNLAETSKALLDYFDKTQEINYSEWLAEFNRRKEMFLLARRRLRTLKTELERRAPLEAELRQVSNQARVFAQANFAEQLAAFSRDRRQQTSISDFEDGLRNEVNVLWQMVADEARLRDWQLANYLAESEAEQEVAMRASQLRDDLAADYAVLRQIIQTMSGKITQFSTEVVQSSWAQQVAASQTAYTATTDALRQQGIESAQQAAAVMQRKEALERELHVLTQKQAQFPQAEQDCLTNYLSLHQWRKQLTRIRQHFVDTILNSNSIKTLRITIRSCADVESGEDEFRRALSLGDRHVENVLTRETTGEERRGALHEMVREDVTRPVMRRLFDLKNALEQKEPEFRGCRFHGQFLNALSRIAPETYDLLWCWFPPDAVELDHRPSSRDTWRSLQQASAGQKTAAMLSFILAHGHEPLILDQPEDDLDNALVNDLVVAQLRANKQRRQVIVVTHNPNIVVNADSELVISMAFRGGQIVKAAAGGMQERDVRVQICDIMEGGRDAFRLRYKRIYEDLESR